MLLQVWLTHVSFLSASPATEVVESTLFYGTYSTIFMKYVEQLAVAGVLDHHTQAQNFSTKRLKSAEIPQKMITTGIILRRKN